MPRKRPVLHAEMLGRMATTVDPDFDDVERATERAIELVNRGHTFDATSPGSSGDGHDTCHKGKFYA